MPIYNGKSAILKQANSSLNLSHRNVICLSNREKKGRKHGHGTKTRSAINRVAVDGLFASIEAVKATPSIAKFRFRIRNQWDTGSKNCSTVVTFSGAHQGLSHPIGTRFLPVFDSVTNGVPVR